MVWLRVKTALTFSGFKSPREIIRSQNFDSPNRISRPTLGAQSLQRLFRGPGAKCFLSLAPLKQGIPQAKDLHHDALVLPQKGVLDIANTRCDTSYLGPQVAPFCLPLYPFFMGQRQTKIGFWGSRYFGVAPSISGRADEVADRQHLAWPFEPMERTWKTRSLRLASLKGEPWEASGNGQLRTKLLVVTRI